MPTYTTSQVAKLTGIPSSSIRNYTTNPLFRSHFSATSTPQERKSRQLTDRDIRILQYIHEGTKAKRRLADIARELDAGELADWQPEEATEPPQEAERALALVNASIAGLEAIHLREAILHERITELTAANATLAAENDRLAAQNAELHAKLDAKRSLWSRLFG